MLEGDMNDFKKYAGIRVTIVEKQNQNPQTSQVVTPD